MTVALEEPTPVNLRVQGPLTGLFRPPGERITDRYDEVLIAGPAGTGKTFDLCLAVHTIATDCPPGTRILIVRQTLDSLRESVQQIYEDEILANDTDWAWILERGGTRYNRRHYDYPNCHVALRGLDKPGRLYSSRWDLVWVEEAWECSRDAIARFVRGTRFSTLGRPCIVLTTNPSGKYHWINRGFPAGYRTPPKTGTGYRLRLLSRHEDNPVLATKDPELLTRLGRLPEPLRSQLLLGEWVSAQGLVWPQYDEGTHLVDRWVESKGERRYYLCGEDAEPIELEWFGASMDFGYSHAGVFGVWGVAQDGRSWLVAEVYRTGWQHRQWADAIEELNREFPLEIIVADCEDPGFIAYLNAELSFARGGKTGQRVQGADKSRGKLYGLNAVRRALDEELVHFLRPERRMRCWPDEGLKEGRPTCSTEEILGYSFRDPELATTAEQAAIRERDEMPTKGVDDDGCDMIRYWCTYKYADWDPRYVHARPKREPTATEAAWILTLPAAGGAA